MTIGQEHSTEHESFSLKGRLRKVLSRIHWVSTESWVSKQATLQFVESFILTPIFFERFFEVLKSLVPNLSVPKV